MSDWRTATTLLQHALTASGRDLDVWIRRSLHERFAAVAAEPVPPMLLGVVFDHEAHSAESDAGEPGEN